MVLRWCQTGAAVVLQRCEISVIILNFLHELKFFSLQVMAMILQWGHSDVSVVLQWCHRGVTVVSL
jgi:hypothetical protein